MSATKFKNAKKVWNAVLKLTVGEGVPMPRLWMTIKEISEISRLSKPTVKRYMDLAVEQGAASKWIAPSGLLMYRANEVL